MSKELEALNELSHRLASVDTSRTIEEAHYDVFPIIRKSLTPPTADEVCVKITDFINGLGFVEEKIQVIYNSEDKEFYYMSKRTDDVVWYKKIVVAIQTINSTKDRTVFLDVINLPPHLITMIGKFYESLEGEK